MSSTTPKIEKHESKNNPNKVQQGKKKVHTKGSSLEKDLEQLKKAHRKLLIDSCKAVDGILMELSAKAERTLFKPDFSKLRGEPHSLIERLEDTTTDLGKLQVVYNQLKRDVQKVQKALTKSPKGQPAKMLRKRVEDEHHQPFKHWPVVCILPDGRELPRVTDAEGYFEVQEDWKVYVPAHEPGSAIGSTGEPLTVGTSEEK